MTFEGPKDLLCRNLRKALSYVTNEKDSCRVSEENFGETVPKFLWMHHQLVLSLTELLVEDVSESLVCRCVLAKIQLVHTNFVNRRSFSRVDGITKVKQVSSYGSITHDVDGREPIRILVEGDIYIYT